MSLQKDIFFTVRIRSIFYLPKFQQNIKFHRSDLGIPQFSKTTSPPHSESTFPPPIVKVYIYREKPLPLITPIPDHPLSISNRYGNDPPSNDSSAPSPLRRYSRISVPPNIYGFSAHFTFLDSSPIPTSHSQASKISCQQDVMTKQLLARKASSTRDLVHVLAGSSIIGSKWVSSIKVQSNGSLD